MDFRYYWKKSYTEVIEGDILEELYLQEELELEIAYRRVNIYYWAAHEFFRHMWA